MTQPLKLRRHLRSVGTATTITLMALTLAACGNDASAGGNDSVPVVKVTTFPTTPFLSVWVAEKKGFDRRHNIQIREITTGGGNTLYTPLVGGQADASIILPSLTLQYAAQGVVASGKGSMAVVPALTVKATESHPATAIVAGPGINKPSDLIGKTIATHNEVSGFFTLARATLAKDGVPIDNNDPKAAHSTVLPMGQMGNAIRLGKIDAGIMDYYSASAAVANGDGHILMPVLGTGEWSNYPYSMWAFNRKFFDNSKSTVERFLMAMLDANKWILSHSEEAKQILITKMGTPPGLAKKFIGQYPMDGFTTDLEAGNLQATPIPELYKTLLHDGSVKRILPLDQIFEPATIVRQTQKAWMRR